MISVVMPVFNAEQYVGEAIKSILGQTYKNFEFIVINDASIDQSEKVIKSFKDRRIRYFRNQINSGVAKSLNKGLQVARGDYIARLDADDIASKDRFKKQVAFLRTYKNTGVVGSWVILIDDEGKQLQIKKYPEKYVDIKNEAIIHNPLNHSTVMFRRSLIQQYGGHDEKLNGAEDYDLWLRFLKFTKIENIPEPFVQYRLLKHGVSFKSMRRVEKSFIKAKIKSVVIYQYPFWHLIVIVKSLLSFVMPLALRNHIYEKYFNY